MLRCGNAPVHGGRLYDRTLARQVWARRARLGRAWTLGLGMLSLATLMKAGNAIWETEITGMSCVNVCKTDSSGTSVQSSLSQSSFDKALHLLSSNTKSTFILTTSCTWTHGSRFTKRTRRRGSGSLREASFTAWCDGLAVGRNQRDLD